MRYLAIAALLVPLATTALAQPVSKESLLKSSQDLGTLVGQAVQCGVEQAVISRFLDTAIPNHMPTTNDAAFNEQMNSAFEQAMRSAGQPAQGCDPVVLRFSAPQ